MDQDLSRWLHEHQNEIQHRWWTAAQETESVSDTALKQLAQEDAFGIGPFRPRILASLAVEGPANLDWVETLAQELDQQDLLMLLSALRQTLFDLLLQQAGPQRIAEPWRVLNRHIDRMCLAIIDAFSSRLTRLDAEREHWRALYSLTHELSASMDLGYVLQTGIQRVLDALGAHRGAVFLLDTHTDQVKLQAAREWQDVTLNLSDLPPGWQRGHGQPQVLKAAEVDASTFQPFIRDEAETIVVAPLLANGRFHGLLAVATSDVCGFDVQQLNLIDAVVNNLASSLGSSEVIETLNEQARELGLLLRQHQEESSKREAILASIADGVVFNDQHGQVMLVNRAAEQILVSPAEDLIGRDLSELFDLFTAGAREEILEAMQAIVSDPGVQISPEAAQTVLQRDNLTISAHLAPVITEREEFLGIVTIFRDITKEVEADRAKSEFVSTVSHELRTPMTAIKGYTDLLYSEMVGRINDNQKRFLGIVRNNADRLTALISDLLDISRVETGRLRFEPEPVDLGDIVKNVIDALAPNAAEKGHKLTCRVEAGLSEIMGDPDRLNQVFVNLVGNAINYTPNGGEVTVDVYSVGGAVRADVRDNGIGIRGEDLGRIFERFYRADHPLVQESHGTGLGLPIVKMFIEMHGGRVWADSTLGKGSSFTVILPLPTTPAEEIPALIAPEVVGKLGKRHVLVADDDPDIAELVKLQLEEEDFRATVVGRGVKACELARRHCPDLIILDILLPDMDGRAVLEVLKSDPSTADIPVVMLTVVADDGTASDLGAAGYVTKPIEGDELLEAVRTALMRRGRVLVVEDDVDTIQMMRLALRRVGYNVDIAADGYEALSLARRWRPKAIVLDLRLPGMDGYEALTHLKRSLATQGIPIIVISAHSADPEKEEERLKKMGVMSFLPKPFTIKQLVSEVDRATRGIAPAHGEDKASSVE